jgi:soluble lytic murein transglycosylase
MRPRLLLAPLFVLSAAFPGQPDSYNAAASSTIEQEHHLAPQVPVENAPPEAQLSPPADAETVQVPPGYVGVSNPAFPVLDPSASSIPLGRRFDPSDLAPYFSKGKTAEAKAQFDQGHFSAARQLLADQGNSPLPVRYLRALSALRAELYEEAAEEMSALAGEYTALRDRCFAHAALAFEELHQFSAAAEKYQQVPPGSRLYGDAQLGLARVLHRMGNVDGAIDALASTSKFQAPGWGRDIGAEALAALADLLRERRKFALERAALIKLWTMHALSPLSNHAEKRLGLSSLPVELRLVRAEQLIEAHRNRRGLALLQSFVSTLKLPDPLACRAQFAYGKGLRKERQHTKAVRALVPVVARCRDPDLRARAMYVLGSSRSIIDPTHAAQTYEALAREFPNHAFADDALFYAADLHLRSGEVDRAIAMLRRVTVDYRNGDFAAESLFKLFWIHRDRGELKPAIEILDEVEARYGKADESYEVERAHYWKARSLEHSADAQAAAPLLEALTAEHPTTYYGLLARIRLGQLDPARAERVARQINIPSSTAGTLWPLFAGPMSDEPHFLAAVELLRLGFADAVPSELLAVDRPRLSRPSVRLLVELLAAAGDARSAHAVARASLRADLSGRIRPENLFVWQIAYPNAFHDVVERHCREMNVDPYLLQALIREESALDPKALSWAGALGLSQLMLPTAQGIARTLKISGITQDSLLEPDLNLRLGSWYLGTLLKRFEGNKAEALAAYNAGAGVVKQWRAAKSGLDLDAWIEEIPFAETRGYVKRVMRSYNTYKLLYGSSDSIQAVSWSGS